MELGFETDWDDVVRIWEYTLNELRVNPEEHPLVFTEAPLDPKWIRAKMTQVEYSTALNAFPLIRLGVLLSW